KCSVISGPNEVERLSQENDIIRNLPETENGDVIYSKVLSGDRKVFRLETVLDATPEEIHHILWKVEEMHQWNPSIKNIKVLKQAGPETMVTHEVSAETAGNLIGQRDFLSVRHFSRQESCIYLGGAATHLETFPPQKGFVRAEDGPTCIIIEPLADDTGRSHFTWLLNMDVKVDFFLKKNCCEKDFSFTQLQTADVLKELQNMDPYKSAGLENLDARFLK
uniref:START domain-containing protein 1 n=1 Tax=Oncorhynchus tshawytscha TaxID=74940 RepID=A0AAZ3QUN3_ONCTS